MKTFKIRLYISSAERIFIGSNVLISDYVHIIDTKRHELDANERAEGFKQMIKTGHLNQKENILTKPIEIKYNVWISFNASILKGFALVFKIHIFRFLFK